MILTECEKNVREKTDVTPAMLMDAAVFVVVAFWHGFATGTAILFILAIMFR